MAAGHRSYRVARLYCAICRATVRTRIQIVDGLEVFPPCPGCSRVAWAVAPPAPAAPPPPAAETPEQMAERFVAEMVAPSPPAEIEYDDRPIHEVLATPEEIGEFWSSMQEEQQEYFRHRFEHFSAERDRRLEADRADVAAARARMWRELWDIVGSTG
jgi:hypothetical protein